MLEVTWLRIKAIFKELLLYALATLFNPYAAGGYNFVITKWCKKGEKKD